MTTLAGWALLLASQCTFPEYETRIREPGESGSSGNGGSAAGEGGEGGNGGSQGGSSGSQSGNAGSQSGSAGTSGSAGEAGASGCEGPQWPIDRCDSGCLTRFPDHCYDSAKSEDELGIDCGGSCQPCVVEPCAVAEDCLSGVCVDGPAGATCESPLLLTQEAHEKNESVGSTAWSLTLKNAGETGGRVFTLRDLRLRYYFERNGVVEPILVRATQANLYLASGTNSALAGARWDVVRVEDVQDASYNAYVEVSFGDSGQLFPGDEIQLYQQMLSGDPSISNFDQRANYSFNPVEGPWEHVTVYYRDQLLWGLEPRQANPRACFARGVNLAGPALTIDGNAWVASGDAYGNAELTTQPDQVFPPVTGDTASMLSSVFRVQTGHFFGVPVDNGEYLLYLYAVSPVTDAMPSAFTVNEQSFVNSSKFRSQASDGGLAWSRLGPYRLDVTDGAVEVKVTTGAIDFAGFELWYPQ